MGREATLDELNIRLQSGRNVVSPEEVRVLQEKGIEEDGSSLQVSSQSTSGSAPNELVKPSGSRLHLACGRARMCKRAPTP